MVKKLRSDLIPIISLINTNEDIARYMKCIIIDFNFYDRSVIIESFDIYSRKTSLQINYSNCSIVNRI